MIVNISHVTLSCDDIQKSTRIISKAGFKVKFIHEAVPNALGKKSFLTAYKPTHALSFCQAETGVAIEVIDHFNVSPPLSISPYKILFSAKFPNSIGLPESLLPELENLTKIWQIVLGCSVKASFWEPFNTHYWYCTDDTEQKMFLKAALLDVEELSAAEYFWTEGIGCRLVNQGLTEGRKWTHVKFATPVSGNAFDVILCERTQRTQRRQVSYMDGTGFCCFAFLTLGLKRVKENLVERGASAWGETFFLEVGGRPLRVKVLRGPNDELIELIELQLSQGREGPAGI